MLKVGDVGKLTKLRKLNGKKVRIVSAVPTFNVYMAKLFKVTWADRADGMNELTEFFIGEKNLILRKAK